MRLLFHFFALIATTAALAQSPQNQPITITSVEPSGENSVLISWVGGIPPYKLQATYNSASRGWRDVSFHIYTNRLVVPKLISSNAFFRVRSIPDSIAPPRVASLRARLFSPGYVLLTWDLLGADNAGGTGLRGVRILRNGELFAEVPYSVTNYVDTTVQIGEVYSYAVFAIDHALNTSSAAGVRLEFLGSSAMLAWDANPEPDIAGYVLSFWKMPDNVRASVDVGNVLIYTVAGLAPDEVYYFAVHAYNTSGLHGPDSNEVTFHTSPLPLP